MKRSSSTTDISNTTSKLARRNVAQPKYDVFLSFRGGDTREGFVSHLFDALCRNQINTFLDENLNIGEDISNALLQTIKESYVSVVIFSENYAYSPWCLDELQTICECKRTMGQRVLPVFYRVDPTDVQDLTGSYGDALTKHREEFNICLEKVETWSDAVKEISGISGLVSQNLKPESKLIEEIVNHILKILEQAFSNDSCDDGLVGMESRIKDVETLLNFESTEVRFLGIWGMPGIGKTTLASKVFDRFSSQFESRCFIANVREKLEKGTLDGVQQEILSKLLGIEKSNFGIPIMLYSTIRRWIRRKKVLIVLDDVSDLEQLQFLIGDPAIYAPGSRIIMTSRDKQILQNGGSQIYKVQKLKNNEAHQLFLLHALKQNPTSEAYVKLAEKVVKYAQGIPLAIKVLGSNLYNKSLEECENELEKLEGVSDKKIEKILKLSFDELDENGQKIFLDIACFFNLGFKDHVVSVLDSCGLYARTGISRLLDKSLISISDRKLVMHDLLKQMGHDIVRKEGKNPGERSRLWIAQDIYHVFRKEMGTASVESISLDVIKIRDIELSCIVFSKMSDLRFLEFYNSFCRKGFSSNFCLQDLYASRNGVHLPKAGLSSLPDELRYLYWFQYPAKSLPFNFFPDNLVQLHLIHSQVEDLCFEHKSLENLKVMDLSFSLHLIKIPDLSKLPKLEVLCLKGCLSLVEIRSSIRYHSKLSHLDLGNCKNLRSYPRFLDLRNLEFLCLEGCSIIRDFPEVPEKIKQIILSGTAIQQVPSSIGHRTLLTTLEFKSCAVLKSLPSSIGELKCLENLRLKGCSELMTLPDDICNLKSLVHFDISSCRNLNGLPENLGNLQSLQFLNAGKSGIKKLPSSINSLGKLLSLRVNGCKGLELPPFTAGLSSLGLLCLDDCGLLEIPDSIGSLVSLMRLSVGGNDMEMLPTVIKQLAGLCELNVRDCKRLKYLPDLPSALQHLTVRNCTSLNLMSTSLARENISLGWFDAGNCMNFCQKEQRHIVDDMLMRIQSISLQLRDLCHRNCITPICSGFRFGGHEVQQKLKYQNNNGSFLQFSMGSDRDDTMLLAFSAVVAFDGYHSLDCISVDCICTFMAEYGSEDIRFQSCWQDDVSYGFVERGDSLHESEKMVCSEQTLLWLATISLPKSEYSVSEASFEFYAECKEDGSYGIEVIKCGIHLFEDDEDDHNHINPPSLEDGEDCEDGKKPSKLDWITLYYRDKHYTNDI